MNKDRKTTPEDMQRLYDYLDKTGVTYTVNTNPSEEEIARIKAAIARTEEILKINKEK